MSIHYHASGVILNHNFTKAFYTQDTKDCEPCQNLTNNIRKGVSKRDHISFFISTPILNYHFKHFSSFSLAKSPSRALQTTAYK